MSALHADLGRCFWCEEPFKWERGTRPEDGIYAEEVGEFWNKTAQDSVLGHPDCTPRGLELILMDQDPEWQMA